MSKICSKCGVELPLTDFHKDSTRRGGHAAHCKKCCHAYRVAYYAKNQQKATAYSREYYAQNTDAAKAYHKEYDQRNKYKVRARSKQWRDDNREVLLAKKKADYEKNKDHYSNLSKSWRRDHPEYGRRSHHHRRAKQFGVSGHFTARGVIQKFTYFGWRCYLCGKAGTIHTLEIDHRTPMSRGGSNWIANIAPACAECNQAKRQRTEKEYRASLMPP